MLLYQESTTRSNGVFRMKDCNSYFRSRLITDRSFAEQFRPETVEPLVWVFKECSSGIVVTRVNGRICFVNEAFTQMTGCSLVELFELSPKVSSSGQTPVAIYQKLWGKILTGQMWSGKLLNRRKDRTFYWEAISIAPLYDREGFISHFVAVVDTIERKPEQEANAQRIFANIRRCQKQKEESMSLAA